MRPGGVRLNSVAELVDRLGNEAVCCRWEIEETIMTLLLFVEAEARGLGEAARRALTAARKIGPVDVLLVGADCAPAIAAALAA